MMLAILTTEKIHEILGHFKREILLDTLNAKLKLFNSYMIMNITCSLHIYKIVKISLNKANKRTK